VRENMTRSILLEAADSFAALDFLHKLEDKSMRAKLAEVVAGTSKHTALQDWHVRVVGNLLFIRFSFSTGNAAGHNMSTKAAEALLDFLLAQFKELKYVSLSGNYCTDKKVSSVNAILGRGKYVVAEMIIPQKVCVEVLRSTPDAVVDLHIKKNLIGSILAGGVESANAHFANMLLAFYLATGQDAANIVEGSQGIVHAEVQNGDLYFSVTLPNVIVGVIGSGKKIGFVQENLKLMGCQSDARKLAMIAAAIVWCGEISLLAALCNRGELMRAHVSMERQ
jgi:hydroxymethylglutaryl-CoA reductase (NADPH)